MNQLRVVLLVVFSVGLVGGLYYFYDPDPQPPQMTALEMVERVNEVVGGHEPSSTNYYIACYNALRVGDWLCVFCDVRTQELKWRYVGPARRKTWNVMEQRWQ